MLEEEGQAIKLDIRGQSCGLTDLKECHSRKITFIFGDTFYPRQYNLERAAFNIQRDTYSDLEIRSEGGARTAESKKTIIQAGNIQKQIRPSQR